MPEPDREAYEAAERLVREAQEKAEQAARAAASDAPPNGWSSGSPPPGQFPDLSALLALVDGLRGQVPPELTRQLADALRELLIALRAVLDYTIQRLDRPPPEERTVEDIPDPMNRFASVSKELQLAALAAAALALSLVLPWYQKSVPQQNKIVQGNVSALGVFTFVEAAILLVSVAVLFLVWARSRRKGFHLPGGDGVAVTAAGAWAVLLLVWRMFDRPAVKGVGVDLGIQWGLFVALVCAAGLIVAGARIRAARAPEPPNPAADDLVWVAAPQRQRERPSDRRPRDATAVTDVLRDPPRWEDDAPTTKLPDAPTTRLPDAPTTKLPDRSEERTQRLWEDDPPAP